MEALVTRVDDDEVTITVKPSGSGPEYEFFFRRSAIIGAEKPYQLSVFGDKDKIEVITFPG